MNKSSIVGICVFLFLSLLLSGCVQEATTEDETDSPKAGPVHAGDVVEGSNIFAWELYEQLVSEDPDTNIFISPWSIEAALAMTYEGARGNTAKEMQDTLHFPENNKTRREGFQQLLKKLNEEKESFDLSSANRIFPREGYPFDEDFFDILEEYFYSEFEALDFGNDPEACRKTINDWVEEQTNDKIQDILKSGDIDVDTVLVLANAIYFKSAWKYEFDTDQTADRSWTLPGGSVKTVPTMYMHTDEVDFNYFEDDTAQALELPYRDDALSMVIILPKKDDISELQQKIDEDYIKETIDGMTKEEVEIFLPKFEMECIYNLEKKTLPDMGIIDAFTPQADFTGMSPAADDLYITKVIHKSFVEVNEEGTEAAAATVVVIGNYSSGPPESEHKIFNADHNFIFLIKDNSDDNILFLGKVTDPEE